MVFLDSFITYANGGRLVGFNRTGDRVLFAEYYASSLYPWQQSLGFNVSDTYPDRKQLIFPSTQIPLTATSLILDIQTSGSSNPNTGPFGNSGGNSEGPVLLLDPQFNGIYMQGGNCLASVISIFDQIPNGPSYFTYVSVNVPISQASSVINLGVCSQPSGNLDVTARYAGYIEPVHALTYLHP
jgi:hypothetical protein